MGKFRSLTAALTLALLVACPAAAQLITWDADQVTFADAETLQAKYDAGDLGGVGEPLSPIQTLPVECDPDSTCIAKSGMWFYDRLPAISMDGYDGDGSQWGLNGLNGYNTFTDFIRPYTDITQFYSAKPIKYFGPDNGDPTSGGDSVLTIASMDTDPYGDVVTWAPGVNSSEDIDYAFCRDSTTPFDPSVDNTSNYSVAQPSRPDAWICRDASADVYYKVAMSNYLGCSGVDFRSNVYVMPFDVEDGVDDCQPYSLDKSHASHYGARWDAQQLLAMTDADVIENNLWPARESGTTAGFSGTATSIGVTTASHVDWSWNGTASTAGLAGYGIQCLDVDAGATCEIDAVSVAPGVYQFSVMVRVGAVGGAGWTVTPIDEGGTAYPDAQVNMFMLDGGAPLRDSSQVITAASTTAADRMTDWIRVQGWVEVVDETGLGLRFTSGSTSATANMPVLYVDEWGLERSKTLSLNVEDHLVLQGSTQTHRMQFICDSHCDPTSYQYATATLSNGVRYMQGLPYVAAGGWGGDPITITPRSTRFRDDLQVTVDDTYGVGGAKLRDLLGSIASGGQCVPNASSALAEALALPFETTILNFGQNDMLGSAVQGGMALKDPGWRCLSWASQMLQLDRMVARANRKAVIFALSPITRTTVTSGTLPCKADGFTLTPRSCWDTMVDFRATMFGEKR